MHKLNSLKNKTLFICDTKLQFDNAALNPDPIKGMEIICHEVWEDIKFNTLKGMKIVEESHSWINCKMISQKKNYQITSEREDSEVEHGASRIGIWCWLFPEHPDLLHFICIWRGTTWGEKFSFMELTLGSCYVTE